MCYIGETAGTNTDGGCATQYSNRESWRSNRSRLLEGAALIHQRTRSEDWQIECRSRLNGRSVVDRFSGSIWKQEVAELWLASSCEIARAGWHRNRRSCFEGAARNRHQCASCYDQSIVAWRWVKRNKGRYIDNGFMLCTQQC
jgi:hypothetical protein